MRRALAPLTLMVVIFYLSAQPDLSSGLGVWDTILRKAAHMIEYAALAALWAWTLWAVVPRRAAVAAAAAIAIAYAVSDELHQSTVEGRNGSPVDVGIDAIGVAAVTLRLRYDRGPRRAVPEQREDP